MGKTIFLIPGFNETTQDAQYRHLLKALQSKGYATIGVPIAWHYRTMSDYVAQFEDFYEKNKSRNNFVLGFSYGAEIALLAAPHLKPAKAFLCSISADFKEDLEALHDKKDRIIRLIGIRRYEDCQKRSAARAAQNLTIPSAIFCGEKEGDMALRRSTEIARLSQNSKLIIVKDAPHAIHHREYVEAISKEL